MAMKSLMSGLCLSMALLLLTSCGSGVMDDARPPQESEIPEKNLTQPTEEEPLENEDRIVLDMTIGNQVFKVKLYVNQTTEALVALLPMTLDMDDLNSNEKFYFLPDKFPTDPEVPGQIRTGDIMLYGDDCLVVFYESFSSSYPYTRLGYVEDAVNMEQAVGNGTVQITFEAWKSQ